jgi:hypothetical protein
VSHYNNNQLKDFLRNYTTLKGVSFNNFHGGLWHTEHHT